MPCPYSIIVGRDTALPSPNFLRSIDAIGILILWT
jgi:hypothetical protein